jgi:hypothetical protein
MSIYESVDTDCQSGPSAIAFLFRAMQLNEDVIHALSLYKKHKLDIAADASRLFGSVT